MNVLTWVGSKRENLPDIIDVFKSSGKPYNRFFDAMTGSACVSLGFNHPNTIINDINPDIINLYRVIADTKQYEDFANAFVELVNDKESYYKTRNAFNSLENGTAVDSNKAAMFYYLVNFGFRGLARYNRKGELNMPYGCVKASTAQYLQKHKDALDNAHQRFANWTLSCDNAMNMLEQMNVGKGDLVYFDPPYHDMAQPYIRAFDDDRLQRLLGFACTLVERGADVVISYSENPMTDLKNAGFTVKELRTYNKMANTHRTDTLSYFIH